VRGGVFTRPRPRFGLPSKPPACSVTIDMKSHQWSISVSFDAQGELHVTLANERASFELAAM
jgi:hypothetical protein